MLSVRLQQALVSAQFTHCILKAAACPDLFQGEMGAQRQDHAADGSCSIVSRPWLLLC